MLTQTLPFFIVGSPRSGTTLLQTLIDAHPRLAIPPESHVFDHFWDLLPSYGNLSVPKNLQSLASDILKDERIKRWGLSITADDFCRGVQMPATFQSLLNRLFYHYAQREEKVRWGDKTPEHTLYLDAILKTFPEAKFIHLVRDGRDVAESLSRMFFGPVTMDRKAVLWRDYVSSFQRFKAQLKPDQFLEVRYENLVRSPESEIQRIMRFLGEEAPSVSGAQPSGKLKEIYLKTDDGAHQSLNQPVSDKKVGAFKQGFSPREIEIFESIAGQALKEYGYELLAPHPKGLQWNEKIYYFTLHQFRFFTKLGHWSYLKDRIQYWVRRISRRGL